MDWHKKRFGYYYLLIFPIFLFLPLDGGGGWGCTLFAEEIKTYNLFASDEPEKYLEVVNYQPLIEKAREISRRWSNDGKKAEAIANWVGSSKEYDVGSHEKRMLGIPISGNPSRSGIAALFQAKKGVCNDAAALTVAMLRAVEIPARVLWDVKYKGKCGHWFSQVYFSRRWWAIDSTFDENKNRFSYRQFSELEEPWFTDESEEGRKVVISEDFLFGTLEYPFCKEILVDGEKESLSLNLTCSGSWGSDPTHMRLAGEPVLDIKTRKVAKALYLPRNLSRIGEGKYYLRTKLPPGNYCLSYGIRTGLTGFFQEIGYAKFMISGPNQEIKITAEKLKRSSRVKKKLFQALYLALKE